MLMTNGLSSMGFSLPAAIAAKLVHPSRPVACFTGDGGLAMVQVELQLAASLRIDPLVIVFCDSSLNRIELKQARRHYPSWGKLCSIPWTSSVWRPLVVGAKIDPSQYAAQF